MGKSNFAEQFRKIIYHFKRIWYNLHNLRQTACLVISSITVDSYALLSNCTTAVWSSDSMTASSWSLQTTGLSLMICLWISLPEFYYCFAFILARRGCRKSLEYSSLFIVVIYLIFLCFRYNASTELGAIMRTDFVSCVSVLRVASGPRVKLGVCKSAKNPGILYYWLF